MRGFGNRVIGSALLAALMAGCASGPAPECQPASSGAAQVIDCGNAVAMARDQLPSAHPAITRIQFLYGEFRPIFTRFMWDGVRAYVVFSFADASRMAVPLTLYEGQLSAQAAETY